MIGFIVICYNLQSHLETLAVSLVTSLASLRCSLSLSLEDTTYLMAQ
jgi:nucleoid-associated protein YejK